jgi:hypothetical protein
VISFPKWLQKVATAVEFIAPELLKSLRGCAGKFRIMGKIIEYTIVTEQTGFSFKSDVGGLICSVNEMIVQGWEPIGGLTINSNSNERCQAMVRRADD